MLLANVMHFARVLRSTGLPVGPGRVLDALDAVQATGLESRTDLYWTLHACFVSHPRQREVFDQAFHVFWRNPHLLERMMSIVLPEFRVPGDDSGSALSKRVAEALHPGYDEKAAAKEPDEEQQEFHATMTWSDSEQFKEMDFDSMSAEEQRRAQAAIAGMRLRLDPVMTRRYDLGRGDRVDPRASLRASMRQPLAAMTLVKHKRRTRPPAIVVLSDISGSMGQYSRMMLHFLHALTSARDQVHSFLFGTRLTNITRQLNERDVDVALEMVSETVVDWSGGTRIGQSLRDFNRHWSRRVLAQGAIVILITDGLDRDIDDALGHEVKRLGRSCRKLIWLNPLLRYEGFEPKTHGARTILPHVDDFRSVHNLTAIEALTTALSQSAVETRSQMRRWRSMLDPHTEATAKP